ncbi:MAG: FAD-dependent oxidoreductase [Hyphomicrobiales bacterium]
MAAELRPDICVIGAGSGGLSVAAAAAAFGVSVVLVEKDRMGGDCLNPGCVPSKALISAARAAAAIRAAGRFGIDAGEPQVDFARVMAHVHGVIGEIAPNDSEERFAGLGVRVIRAAARFTGPDTVAAGGETIRARRFVIATGSRAGIPPIPGLAEVPFLTNETIFGLTELPRRLLVLGGGPIGMELAQAFRRLGAEVVVLEAAAALSRDDPELAAIVVDALRRDGVELREGVRILSARRDGAGVALELAAGDGVETLVGSHLLVAAGRRPNVEDLGLELAGVALGERGIAVDTGLRTTNRRVYAIGDVAGSYQFTHVANYHAGLVLRAILFRLPVSERRDIIPWTTYTDPELAFVGLGEAAARERHGEIRVLRWPFAENDRATAEGDRHGFAKIIATKRGRIVGAGVVGRDAGELIPLYAMAVARKMKVGALAGLVFPYPTRAEVARRAAITYYTPSLTSPWTRRIIAFLRRFG